MKLIEIDRQPPYGSCWINPEHVVLLAPAQLERNTADFGTRIVLLAGPEIVTELAVEAVADLLRQVG